jgi:hypothetical protein
VANHSRWDDIKKQRPGATADDGRPSNRAIGLADSCGRWYEVSNVVAADFTVYVTNTFAADISIHEVTFEYLAGVRE